MSQHVDPAEVNRLRSQRTTELIGQAEEAEADAAMYCENEQEDAEALALNLANNRRLQALCNHLSLPHPPIIQEAP